MGKHQIASDGKELTIKIRRISSTEENLSLRSPWTYGHLATEVITGDSKIMYVIEKYNILVSLIWLPF